MADTAMSAFESLEDLSKVQLVAREAAVEKAYDTAKKAVQGGIDHESPEEIKLAQPALDDAVKQIDYGLDVCERMQAEAQTVMKDAPFVEAHRAELTKMIAHAAEMKKLYVDWAKEMRGLQQQADSAAKSAHQGSRETEAELGGLKNRASLLAVNDPRLQKGISAAREGGTSGDRQRRRQDGRGVRA